MKRNESIQKVMTTQLTTLHTAMKVSEARKALDTNAFRHLPVVSGDKLVGMISSKDMLEVEIVGWGTDVRSLDAVLDHQFTIEQLMTSEVETLPTSAKVRDAANLLAEGRFHSVPVVDDEGRLQGLVTSTDLIRYLADQF
ncbi:MAG: CBS domain-containing protein [Planctomycetes bacterium]|nr:CBS domain-containing protein [Planctomycetota bacterium]